MLWALDLQVYHLVHAWVFNLGRQYPHCPGAPMGMVQHCCMPVVHQDQDPMPRLLAFLCIV